MSHLTRSRDQEETAITSAAGTARARGVSLSDPLSSSLVDPLIDPLMGGMIFRAAMGNPGPAPAAAFDQASTGGGGEIPYRSEMESSFGEDFGSVESYSGRSAESAQMGARAAARGEQVVFADSNPSKELVGHELAHVVQSRQQSTGAIQGSGGVSDPSSSAEREADAAGRAAAAGQRVEIKASPDAPIHLARSSKSGESRKRSRPNKKAKRKKKKNSARSLSAGFLTRTPSNRRPTPADSPSGTPPSRRSTRTWACCRAPRAGWISSQWSMSSRTRSTTGMRTG